MTPTQWGGLVLIAIPFIATFIFICTLDEDGWKIALFSFGFTAFVTGMVWLGAHLLIGG